LYGARSVTPYSVTWRLFSYASMLQVIALPALWPAYADAFSRRDLTWIRKTYRYNLVVSMVSTAVFASILLVVGQRFIALWAGPAAVPSFSLVAAMACWTLVSSLSWSEGTLLGAAGRVKGQAIYSAFGAIVNLAASIWLGRLFGLTGIILGTLAAYVTCIIVPQTIEVARLLREK
jgi:O-antigen/teichoic acid export membrane protein